MKLFSQLGKHIASRSLESQELKQYVTSLKSTSGFTLSSLLEENSNTLGLTCPVSLVLMKPSSHWKDCQVSVLGRMLNVSLPLGIHMVLVMGGDVYDFTLDGLWTYPVSEIEEKDICVCYTFYVSERAAEMIGERAYAAGNTKPSISLVDLWRIGLGMSPHGLVCSTMMLNLLGLDPSLCYLPQDVLMTVMEVHSGGSLWLSYNGLLYNYEGLE